MKLISLALAFAPSVCTARYLDGEYGDGSEWLWLIGAFICWIPVALLFRLLSEDKEKALTNILNLGRLLGVGIGIYFAIEHPTVGGFIAGIFIGFMSGMILGVIGFIALAKVWPDKKN